MRDAQQQALREAEQLVQAADLYEARGQEDRAEDARDRAERLYVDAGLDPAWSSDEALMRAAQEINYVPGRLYPQALTDGAIELTEDIVDPGDGIIIRAEDLVEPEQ